MSGVITAGRRLRVTAPFTAIQIGPKSPVKVTVPKGAVLDVQQSGNFINLLWVLPSGAHVVLTAPDSLDGHLAIEGPVPHDWVRPITVVGPDMDGTYHLRDNRYFHFAMGLPNAALAGILAQKVEELMVDAELKTPATSTTKE